LKYSEALVWRNLARFFHSKPQGHCSGSQFYSSFFLATDLLVRAGLFLLSPTAHSDSEITISPPPLPQGKALSNSGCLKGFTSINCGENSKGITKPSIKKPGRV
jgi:hypothetical protein